MPRNRKKYQHAEHNEKACKYLHKSNNFVDWVITTAFYSAIHFADYVLFPGDYETLSGDIKHFETFDNFYFMCRGEYDDRHMFRYSLIEQTIPEIADDFKTLMDNCRTARYVEYNFPAKIGDLSIKCLNDIKEVCSD